MTNNIVNRRKPIRYATKRHIGNAMFLLPTVALFACVVLVPFFQGIPYSFTNWKSIVSENHQYNGLANYIYLLGNKYFKISLAVTFKFTILYLLSANLLGFALALMISKSTVFNNVARTVFFLPFTVSITAAAIVWSYVFTDIYGTITGFISPLGLPTQNVAGQVMIDGWRDTGYTMLIYIAALQTISADYYEAATVEGANGWQKFWHITIPMIVPAFTTNITLLLAWGLRSFDLPMIVAANMVEGQTTAVYIYQSIFANSKAGLGQAAAIILTVILIVLTQVVTRILRRLEVEL